VRISVSCITLFIAIGSSPRRRSPRTDIAERGTAYVSQQRHSLRGECLSSTASTSREIGSRSTRRAELS
jgi:hypothetical protein